MESFGFWCRKLIFWGILENSPFEYKEPCNLLTLESHLHFVLQEQGFCQKTTQRRLWPGPRPALLTQVQWSQGENECLPEVWWDSSQPSPHLSWQIVEWGAGAFPFPFFLLLSSKSMTDIELSWWECLKIWLPLEFQLSIISLHEPFPDIWASLQSVEQWAKWQNLWRVFRIK